MAGARKNSYSPACDVSGLFLYVLQLHTKLMKQLDKLEFDGE